MSGEKLPVSKMCNFKLKNSDSLGESNEIDKLRGRLMKKLNRLCDETQDCLKKHKKKPIFDRTKLDNFLRINGYFEELWNRRYNAGSFPIDQKKAEMLDKLFQKRKLLVSNFELFKKKLSHAEEVRKSFGGILWSQINLYIETMIDVLDTEDYNDLLIISIPDTEWIKTAECSEMDALIEEWDNLKLGLDILLLFSELQIILLATPKQGST